VFTAWGEDFDDGNRFAYSKATRSGCVLSGPLSHSPGGAFSSVSGSPALKVGDALADRRLVQNLEDNARARLPRLPYHRPGIDDAAAQGQVRVAGVGRPAIVVQVDVRQLGMWFAQKVVKGAADGGVAGVEDEAERAEVEVAGRAPAGCPARGRRRARAP